MLSSKHIYELMVWVVIAIGVPGAILTIISPIYWVILYESRRQDRRWGPSRFTVVLYFLLANLIFWGGFVYPKMLHVSGHNPQTEAKTNLGALFTMQVAYYGEHNTYAGRRGENGTGCFSDMGLDWRPEPMRWNNKVTNYNYYCGHDVIRATKSNLSLPYPPDSLWPEGVPKPQTSKTAFTLVAIGNVDFDNGIDVWTINDSKELKCIISDLIFENDINATVYDILQEEYVTSWGLEIPWLINLVLTPLLIVSMLFDRKRKKSKPL